jgi:putative transposase
MEREPVHLRRLSRVFTSSPIYFVTVTSRNRFPLLAHTAFHAISEEVWQRLRDSTRWSVGPYVIMPDHVHFFCQAPLDSTTSLSDFVGRWKQWTSKHSAHRLEWKPPLWQPEFFDHLLRSKESLREKAQYVWNNPVRANLTDDAEAWPFRGNPDAWVIQ